MERSLNAKNPRFDPDTPLIVAVPLNNAEEDFHGVIENNAIKYIKLILKENIKFFQIDEEYIDFMIYLCTQYMRTKNIRNKVLSNTSNNGLIDFDKIWNVLSHIFATNMAYTICSKIQSSQFHVFLVKNKTQKELITGDQPVINTYATDISNNELVENLELYYPVSPSLAILITEHNYNNYSNEIIWGEDEVNKYNLMIIKQSHSQVYSSSKEVLMGYIRHFVGSSNGARDII